MRGPRAFPGGMSLAVDEVQRAIALAGIVGPTASGKTDLAVDVAVRLGCEIVSADSRLIFRGMDVGTAKPSPETLRAVPHHMVDVADPGERYDAFRYREEASAAIRGIAGRGKLPLLVGGTGLYVRALVDGLFEGPGRDEKVREQLEAELARSGAEGIHARLREADPASAERLHPNDVRRVMRALEVLEVTGRPISSLMREKPGSGRRYRLHLVGLDRDGVDLRRRIASRIDAMFDGGLVEEVRGLLAKGYGRGLVAMEAIGYRDVIDLLDGLIEVREAKERMVRATRDLAKRQLTWFRADKRIRWVKAESSSSREELSERVSGMLAPGGA